MGVLQIIYIVLIGTAVILQFLLYKGKEQTSMVMFVINMLFSLVLVYIAFTSLPTNFAGQRILTIGLGALAVFAVILRVITEKSGLLSKIMLSVTVIVSFLQLLL